MIWMIRQGTNLLRKLNNWEWNEMEKGLIFLLDCFPSHLSVFCQSWREDTDIAILVPFPKQPSVPPGVGWEVYKLTYEYRGCAPCLTLHVENERICLQTGLERINLCTGLKKWDKKAKIKGLNVRNRTKLRAKRGWSISDPSDSACTFCFFLLVVSFWWPSHRPVPSSHFHSH